MATTRVSRKGQVIIPKQIREARRWTPGTQLEVRETAEGVLLTQLAAAAKRPVRQGVVAIRERVGYRGEPSPSRKWTRRSCARRRNVRPGDDIVRH